MLLAKERQAIVVQPAHIVPFIQAGRLVEVAVIEK